MLSLKSSRRILTASTTIILLFFCLLFAFPFVWMLFATFKSNYEIFTPMQFFPTEFSFRYYKELLSGEWIPFTRQYLNSLLIASSQTLLALILSVSAGFVFGMYKFPWRRSLYFAAILAILIPRQVIVLPLFVWLNRLHILNQPLSVILPGMVTGIGVIYFTLMFKHIPNDLADLARTEGASEYRLFIITLPLIKPAILTYGLIHFILAWHEHIIPLVMLSSPEQLTVSVSLASLAGTGRVPYALLMTGSMLTVIPTVFLFTLLYKNFKSSLSKLTAQ